MPSRGPDHPLWTRSPGTGREWRRSSHCGSSTDCYSSNCVEVSVGQGTVRLRDSADTGGAVLAFHTAAWADFVDLLKRQQR